MKRHTLLLGNYPFLVDILDSNDLGYQTQKEYYILKNSYLNNDTLIDTDVLFLEKDLVDNDDYSALVWPMAQLSNIPFMSTNISAFNKGITSSTELKTGLKKLYDNDLKEKKLNTLLVRVWHPQTLVNRDLLVYADSYINSVHFHWLAKKMHEGGTSTITEEVRVGQTTYIEHFDFLIPDFKDFLFGNTWIEDNLPISDESVKTVQLNKILSKDNWSVVEPKKIEKQINQVEYNLLTAEEQKNCTPTILTTEITSDKYDKLTDEEKEKCIFTVNGQQLDKSLIQNKTIKENCKISLPYQNGYLYSKSYYENPENITQLVNCRALAMQWKYGSDSSKIYVEDEARTLQLSDVAVKVTLFGYSGISKDGIYLCKDILGTASTTFNEDFKVTIGCEIGFDNNGTISVIGKFHWNRLLGSLTEAWNKIYNVNISKYDEYSKQIEKSPEGMEFMEGDSHMLKYSCIIASDIKMTHVIHMDVNYSNDLDDFAVPMHGLFKGWREVPDEVYAKVMITDRLVGQTLASPTCRFTREKLKYTINELLTTRSSKLVEKQTLANFSHMPAEYNKIEDMNNTDNFNFIDKINCIIQQPTAEKTEVGKTLNNTSSDTARVIYKPIFFKTKDAQPVTIRTRVSQNIGINLSEYMTKVDTFIMRIDSSIDCEEIGRSNVYVLFKVDANKIENAGGNYDILTEDGDYVTSGTYTII